MRDDDLCYMSAEEAILRFKNLSLSPVELLDAIIARASSISDTVNPFADCYFDEARDKAKKSEALYVNKNSKIGALEGILCSQDICEIAENVPLLALINENNVCEMTSPHVQRLIDAGANLFARTTIPEFAWLFTTQSRM